MAIRVEKQGAVTTVIMDRPEARNAVDGPSARALADAFRAFDADAEARVAVLWGAGGTFCAGADLKAFGTGNGLRVGADRRRAHGPDPLAARQAGDRRRRGLRSGRRTGARALVRPSRGRGDRHLRRVLPAVGRAPPRRGNRPPAPPDRDEPRDGSHPHRPTGGCARGAARWGWPIAWCRRAPRAPRRKRWRARWPTLPQTCLRSDRRSAYEGSHLDLDAALAREYALGRVTRDSGESRDGAARFAAGEGRHGKAAPAR